MRQSLGWNRPGWGGTGLRGLFLSATVLTSAAATATATDWLNPSGGDWHDPANWFGGQVPSAGDEVMFALPGQYDVTLSSGATTAGIQAKNTNVGIAVAPGVILQTYGAGVDNATLRFFGGGQPRIGDLASQFPSGSYFVRGGTIEVSGLGTRLRSNLQLELSDEPGQSFVRVLSGARMDNGQVLVGAAGPASTGNILVSGVVNGSFSRFDAELLRLGYGGTGQALIEGGGRITAGHPLSTGVVIGDVDGVGNAGTGVLEVRGNQSILQAEGNVFVGHQPGTNGLLMVTQSGQTNIKAEGNSPPVELHIGEAGGKGRVVVTDPGSSIRVLGPMFAHQNDNDNVVMVTGGAQLRPERLEVHGKNTSAAENAVIVQGANSVLSTTGKLRMNTGKMVIRDGATVEAGIALVLGNNRGLSTATVRFEGGNLRVADLAMEGGDLILSAGNDKIVRTGGLHFVAPNGQIDLADNAMMIDYFEFEESPLRLVANSIVPPSPNDLARITSSAVAADPVRFALGVAEGADLPDTTGSGVRTFFRESVDNTAVLVRYTYRGDTNLDGAVDIGDFARLGANFGQPGRWFNGDFNFDGEVNLADFAALAANFGESLPTTQSRGSAVPEPAGIVTLALAGLARRRRH